RTDRFRKGNAADTTNVRRGARQSHLRQQLSAGAAAGGARGSFRAALPYGLGPSRRSGTAAGSGGARGRPAHGRTDSRSQTAGTPGAYIGNLGRGIRTHAHG